ncbi:MAG TPA: hypothetical protein VKU94_02930 [Geobacterales bacterium]|nr:hypothetical protein [Geobacterales bacterium]
MTKIPIIDQGKIGTVRYVQYVFGEKKKQVLAYPLYEDVYNAVNEVKGNFEVKPLHEREGCDASNTVYFTNSLTNLCTSGKVNKIRKEIDRQVQNFLQRYTQNIIQTPKD